MKNNIHSIGD